MNPLVQSGDAELPRRIRRVRKRDGRTVPYAPDRIRDAVLRAQSSVGESDPAFADEVRDVVELALLADVERRQVAGWHRGEESEIPDIEAIQDLVERALIEMGHAQVAKAYIVYRDRRSRAREALLVEAKQPRVGNLTPKVRASGGTTSWSRERVVAALIDEAQVARDVADEIASRVEARVFAAGFQRLSTALVRELIDHELVSLGLTEAHRRHEPIGIAKQDLRTLLKAPAVPREADSARPTSAASERVASALLWRFGLDDVLDQASADAHRQGDVFFEDLGQPHVPLCLSVPIDLISAGEHNARNAFSLLQQVAPLLEQCSQGLVLEGAHAVFAGLGKGEASRGLLRGLAALAEATNQTLDLSAIFGARAARRSSWFTRLLVDLAQLTREGVRPPRLFASLSDLEKSLDGEALEAATLLLQSGGLVPVWHAADERFVAPGCRRRPREQGALACRAAVSLNLPRFARRAGPWRDESLLEDLSRQLECALRGLAALDSFQDQMRTSARPSVRERGMFSVTAVGVYEALRILGDGEVRPAQGARLLGFCAEAARRFGLRHGLEVRLTPFFGERAAAHFALLDADRPQASQQRLFDGLPVPEESSGRAYSAGYGMPSETFRNEARHLSSLLAAVPSGAFCPFSTGPSSTASEPFDDWRGFEAGRELSTRGAHERGPQPGSLFRTNLSASSDA